MARLGGLIFGGILGGAAGLVMGILIGVALLGGYGYLTTGGINIPYNTEHTRIAQGFTVYDATDGVSLTCRHIITTEAVFHPYAPMDFFKPGTRYTHSLWTFCAGDDVDVTMTIWGPGETDQYIAEFGRHCGDKIEIRGWGVTFTWPSESDTGYNVALITL